MIEQASLFFAYYLLNKYKQKKTGYPYTNLTPPPPPLLPINLLLKTPINIGNGKHTYLIPPKVVHTRLGKHII